MKNQKGYTAVQLATVFFIISLVIGGVGGWVANVVKLCHSDFAHVTGMLVIRAIGIFVAPLGSVLGFC